MPRTKSYTVLSTAAVIAAAIKAAEGDVYGIHAFNKSAAIGYIRLYDKATAPLTSDTPVWVGWIPASTSGAGFVIPIPDPIFFANGIGIRVTLAVGDNDATVLTANDFRIDVLYG